MKEYEIDLKFEQWYDREPSNRSAYKGHRSAFDYGRQVERQRIKTIIGQLMNGRVYKGNDARGINISSQLLAEIYKNVTDF